MYIYIFIYKLYYVSPVEFLEPVTKLSYLFSGGEVDLSTLVQLIGQKVTNPPAESPENLREMFRMYDKDGSGYISAKEMRHLLTSVGEKLTDDEAEELLKMTNCLKGDKVDCNSKCTNACIINVCMYVSIYIYACTGVCIYIHVLSRNL